MKCFVIMPYRRELHFMYLFMKDALEREFSELECERADKQAMTGLLTDKIARSINAADVVIADCTDANPNVFYELGMAHALNKPTVLLTAETPESVPTDIRGYQFIAYRMDDERSLLADLRTALQALLGAPDDDYERAKQLLAEYSATRGANLAPVSKAVFETRIAHKPMPTNSVAKKTQILLEEVFEGRLTIEVALGMRDWIDRTFPEDDDSMASSRSIPGTIAGGAAT